MRIGAILASGLALSFFFAMGLLAVILVGLVGFMGVMIVGLVVLVIAYNVELEDGSSLGSSYTPELYAAQRQEQFTRPEEYAARHAERMQSLTWIKIAKYIGAALIVVGGLGFFSFQL